MCEESDQKKTSIVGVVMLYLAVIASMVIFGVIGAKFLLRWEKASKIPTVTTVAPEADAFLKDTNEEPSSTSKEVVLRTNATVAVFHADLNKYKEQLSKKLQEERQK